MTVKILVRGWFKIPHSYAVVNMFQLYHLLKNYSSEIEIYTQELPYYNPQWKPVDYAAIYPPDYVKAFTKLKEWKKEPVDLIYSITYPYNIDVVQFKSKTTGNVSVIPKIVFYTSEAANLNLSYFSVTNTPVPKIYDDSFIQSHILNEKSLHFVAPSPWSHEGLTRYLHWNDDSRNHIVTHGVDTHIFYKHSDVTLRNKIRAKYNVDEKDILLMNIGGMTSNKGIPLIIECLYSLVNDVSIDRNYKLLLKGSGDLYGSHAMIKNYFSMYIKEGIFTKEKADILLNKHIIFLDSTFNYKLLNNLYNACDVYVSPYTEEGFNLTPLEALAAGTHVILPKTGVTTCYTDALSGPTLHLVNSRVISENRIVHDGKRNEIDKQHLIQLLKETDFSYLEKDRVKELVDTIETHFSWNKASHDLFTLIKRVVN